MSSARGPIEAGPQPKNSRRKNQHEGIEFKFDGSEAIFASNKTHRVRPNSPLPNKTPERKRSSSTCICGDGTEIPMKILALSGNDSQLQKANTKYVAVKVGKATYPGWEMEAQVGQSHKPMGTNEKFRNTPKENPLELEVNKLITSVSDNAPPKRRRRKYKSGSPTCQCSSSSEEHDRRKGRSDSSLKKKTQLNLNVDYIANKRILGRFGSQYPSKKETRSGNASRNLEGLDRTRSPFPNKNEDHSNHKLKNQNPPREKDFRNTSTNERDRYGHRRNLHGRTKSDSSRNLDKYSTLDEENPEGRNHTCKYRNEESLARKISLKVKEIGSTPRLKPCDCDLKIVGHKRNLRSRTTSDLLRNCEEYPKLNEETVENHSLKYQNEESLAKKKPSKGIRTTPKLKTCECNLAVVGCKRNLHSRIGSSSQRILEDSKLNYGGNEENPEDGNHTFKHQNEESLVRKISSKAKEIRSSLRNTTCECDLAIVGHKRNLCTRSSSPRNLEEYSTLNDETPQDDHHTCKYQAEERFVKQKTPKGIGTTPRIKTCECDLKVVGHKRNLHRRTRNNLKERSTLNYGGGRSTLIYEGNEEKPEDISLTYQNEERMAKKKAKEIESAPRNTTCECDLEIAGRRRNLHNRIGSRSQTNSEEPSTLPYYRENKAHPNEALEKFRNTPTIKRSDIDLQMGPHLPIRCKEENEMKVHPTLLYYLENKEDPIEENPIKINLQLEKFRNTPSDETGEGDLYKSNLHNRTRWKEEDELKVLPSLPYYREIEENSIEINHQLEKFRNTPQDKTGDGDLHRSNRTRWKEEDELKIHPTLSSVDESEELSALDQNQPDKLAASNPVKKTGQTESKDFHNWDRLAPERTNSFEETDKAHKQNLAKISEKDQHHIIEMYFGSNFIPPHHHAEKTPHQGGSYLDVLENYVRAAFLDHDRGEEAPKQAVEEPSPRNQHHEDERHEIDDGGNASYTHARSVTPTRFTSRMECQKRKEEAQPKLEERYRERNLPIGTHIDYSLNPVERESARRKLEVEDQNDLVGMYSRKNYQNSENDDPTVLPSNSPLRCNREDEGPSEEKRCFSDFQPVRVYEILSSSGDHAEDTQEKFICTCSYTGACFKRNLQTPNHESKLTNGRSSPGSYLEGNNHQDEGRAKFPSSEENQGQMEQDFVYSPHTKPQIYSIMGDGLQNSTAIPFGAKPWKATFSNQNRAVSQESLSTSPLGRSLGLDAIQLGTTPKTNSLNSAHVNFSDLSRTLSSSESMECECMSPFPKLDSNRTSMTIIMESVGSRSVDSGADADPLAMTPRRGNLMDSSPSTERGPQEVKYGLLLPPNRSPLKILLVFIQTDPVSDAMSRAADKLGFDVTFSSSYDGALEEFLSKLHDLVVVDTRTSAKSLDFDTLCRSIRNTKGSQHTAVVAIVKRSAFDKDDVTVLSLLDAGYNRCIVETSNIVHCVNELIQLKHSDMRPMAQAATSQALYAALDKCRDIVLITDDSYRLQYANRASERNLGYRHDETLGKTLQEQLIHDPVQVNTMSSSLMRAREWQGPISLRRKGQEAVVSVCKAVPITCAGRAPTHFVMVMDLSEIVEQPVAVTPDKPRGSVHSIRRASTDVRSVGSDFLRRSSLAKLSALPLEAPITKIITLLAQAQEQSNPLVVNIIDKAVEILQSTELYSPHVKDDLKLRIDEPVTSDLISALLTQPHQPSISICSRRSSNDSSVIRSANRPASKVKIPSQIKDLLDTALTWEFDIFRLEELTNKRPLVHLGMSLFLHFDMPATLNCDEKTLVNWLTVIEMNYHADNAYHNSTHAADVMQATAGFLEKDRLKSIMEPLDEATSLLAACAHDIDHPGKSSAFLSNCDNPLAILYNDVTVLENHHAALTFKLTLGDDRVNIFKHLDRETYKVARHNVIDMVLATEMTKHFEHLAKFVNVFCGKSSRTDLETDEYIPITLPENITLVKRMMIKCADVSNPTRPLRLCVEWARRIAEEYFNQTDEEKARGLPVVMPMFDRTTCSIPKSQIGFVDYIVHDMFEAWDAFIDMPELVTYMRQNYIRWKEFDEQGHTTSADIRKLQNTVLMVPMFPTKNPPKRSE